MGKANDGVNDEKHHVSRNLNFAQNKRFFVTASVPRRFLLRQYDSKGWKREKMHCVRLSLSCSSNEIEKVSENARVLDDLR